MADEKHSMIAKAVGLLATVVAAWAAQKLIDTSWKRATGHEPPKPDQEGDVRFREIAAAAAISGAIVALARVLATRGAARLVR